MAFIKAAIVLAFICAISAKPTPQLYQYQPHTQYHVVPPTPLGRQSLPPIFPAINIRPPSENQQPTILNPFRLPGVSVTLIDRNQLIDRLVTRLESLRVVPEGTPVPAPALSANPGAASATATSGNPDEGVRPLIAIANFIERVFQREPGFEGQDPTATDEAATVTGDVQATDLDSSTGSVVQLNQAAVPEETVLVEESAAEPTETDEPEAKYAEAVAYRGGALLRNHEGELYFQRPYPSESAGTAPLELYLGRVHPPRPTVQSSFQQLIYGPQRVETPVLAGAPGYNNILQTPFWFYRRYM